MFFFRLKAELNRTVFREGDPMESRVTPSRDCYLSIFNILEDETAIILIPNRFQQNGRYQLPIILPVCENNRNRPNLELIGFPVVSCE
jgi:hypothetical protein